MRLPRVALAVAVALAAAGVAASYAAAPGPTVVGVAKFPINVTAGDYDLVNQVVDIPPGAMIPKHTHPGPAVVQVLTGSVRLTDAMGDKTVEAGHMFTENPGNAHSAANKGSVPARVSVSYLVPRGADLITIVK
jgi:quercetin dioxygenase-like cupin family protein